MCSQDKYILWVSGNSGNDAGLAGALRSSPSELSIGRLCVSNCSGHGGGGGDGRGEAIDGEDGSHWRCFWTFKP